MKEKIRTPRYSLFYETEQGTFPFPIFGKEKLTLEEIDHYTSQLSEEEMQENFLSSSFIEEKGKILLSYQYNGEQRYLPSIYQDSFIADITREAFQLKGRALSLCQEMLATYFDKNSGFSYFLTQGDGAKYRLSSYTLKYLETFFYPRSYGNDMKEYYSKKLLEQFSNYLEFRKLYLGYREYQNRIYQTEQWETKKKK